MLNLGRVYISSDRPKDDTQGHYFRGVSPEVWAFRIGGYQVCEKWLKDRRGNALTLADTRGAYQEHELLAHGFPS